MDEKGVEARAKDEKRRQEFEQRDEQAKKAWRELGDLYCEVMEEVMEGDYERSYLCGGDW